MVDFMSKTFIPTLVPIEPESDEFTRLIVKSASVGSPDNLDLHKTYFKKTTDWGDKYVKTVRVFIEHAKNADTNRYMFPPKQLIGRATVIENKSDDGFLKWLKDHNLSEDEAVHRWYLVELEKANAYHDYLLQLNNMKVLGLSTQTYKGGVDVQDDGGIDRWWENEITFCVAPADPKTIGHVYELAKSFNIFKGVDVATDIETGAEVTDVTTTPVDDAAKTPSLTDAITNLIGGEAAEDEKKDETEAGETEDTTEKTIGDRVITIEKTVNELKTLYSDISAHVALYGNLTDLPTIVEKLTSLVGAVEELKSLQVEAHKEQKAAISDTNKGVTLFAEHVTKQLSLQVAEKSIEKANELDHLSKVERDELEARRKSVNTVGQRNGTLKANYIPDNAPGG